MNLAEEALRRHVDTPAFFTAHGIVTRAELRRAVLAIASDIGTLGVRRGDRVLLRMTNSVEFAAALLGPVWAGAVPVLQNSQFGRSELSHIIALSRPAAILYASRPQDNELTLQIARDVARGMARREGIRTLTGDSSGGASEIDISPVSAQPDATAFIVFTSGISSATSRL